MTITQTDGGSEGTPTETIFFGEMSLGGMSDAARREIGELFREGHAGLARRVLSGAEARLVA